MNLLRRIALWYLFSPHVPVLPWDWAPRLFEFAIGIKGNRIDKTNEQ